MENVKAKKFYERHGFFQFGIAEKYYNDAENACLMKLRLSLIREAFFTHVFQKSYPSPRIIDFLFYFIT